MAGYGRGYYGDAQLDTSKPARGRNWFTIVAVVGLGAATVWLLWPRSSPGVGHARYPQANPEASPPSPSSPITAIPPPFGAIQKQLQDDALARGFATVEAYEDSVVASAKGLQDAGVKVMLAPVLQHLAPRLTPAAPATSTALSLPTGRSAS